MEVVKAPEPSIMRNAGYFLWFALLVLIVSTATSGRSESIAEAAGLSLGIALALLVLLAIPYFVLRYLAKRKGQRLSWFVVMLWATIIALLLTAGGYYGRSHTYKQNLPPIAAAASPWDKPMSTISPDEWNTIVPQWTAANPEFIQDHSRVAALVETMLQIRRETYDSVTPRQLYERAVPLAIERTGGWHVRSESDASTMTAEQAAADAEKAVGEAQAAADAATATNR